MGFAQAAALPIDRAQRLRYGAPASAPRTRLIDGLQKAAGAGGLRAGASLAWRLLFPDSSYMRALYGDVGPWRLMTRYPARWAGIIREAWAVRKPPERP